MFEILHLGAKLSQLIDSLPSPWNQLLRLSLYTLGIISFAFIVWRLSRSVEVMPYGEVVETWHSPATWVRRFKEIRSHYRRDAPLWIKRDVPNAFRTLDLLFAVLSWIFAAMFIGISISTLPSSESLIMCSVGLAFALVGWIRWRQRNKHSYE